MELKCAKCGSHKIIKNGIVFGWQRYKCKACGYQFTKMGGSGKPMYVKMLTHALYESGMSMRAIAPFVGVTAQSVSRWIKKWHPTYKAEQGNSELLYRVTKDNMLECMDISADEEYLLISNKLPNGVKVNVVVLIPQDDK